MRILLVENNLANLIVTEAILSKEGHVVSTAETGNDAITKCRKFEFDLVLLDILMPKMDGLKTMRLIKSGSELNSHIPIFALTAYCNPADQIRYLSAGFDGVLSKPLNKQHLDKQLDNYSKGLYPQAITKTSIPVDNAPVLDPRIINQLREIGDNQTLTSLQAKFWKGITKSLNDIQNVRHNITEGNFMALTEFRRAIHEIKGASSTMGLARAHAIARRLQNAPPSEIPYLLNGLCRALSRSFKELNLALS